MNAAAPFGVSRTSRPTKRTSSLNCDAALLSKGASDRQGVHHDAHTLRTIGSVDSWRSVCISSLVIGVGGSTPSTGDADEQPAAITAKTSAMTTSLDTSDSVLARSCKSVRRNKCGAASWPPHTIDWSNRCVLLLLLGETPLVGREDGECTEQQQGESEECEFL